MTTKKIYGHWIEWHGGDCPVPPDTFVKVRYLSGDTEEGFRAYDYLWNHGLNDDSDIVEYCVAASEVDLEAATAYTCSRCNGTGRYSFNLIHGTRCYGCGGTGKQKTKPTEPTPTWAVFGQERSTGELVCLYNVRAKTEEGAIERARSTYANAGDAWKGTYSLTSARAIKWADMTNANALTWDEATAVRASTTS